MVARAQSFNLFGAPIDVNVMLITGYDLNLFHSLHVTDTRMFSGEASLDRDTSRRTVD